MRNKPLPGIMKHSPIKQKPGGSVGEALEHHKVYKARKSMPKDINIEGSSKAGKLGKWVKKGSKFLGGKALGVAGMMMATSSKADQPKKGKGTYTSDITKMKGYKKK